MQSGTLVGEESRSGEDRGYRCLQISYVWRNGDL